MFTLFEPENLKKSLNLLLHRSIEADAVSIIEDCIKQGADLAFTIDGITAIEKAALAKKWDVVRLIASLKKTDSFDRFRYIDALVIAINNNQELAAISLIMAGADLDEKIRYQGFDSILHLAIHMKNTRVIEVLVKTNPSILRGDTLVYHAPLAYAAHMAYQSMQEEDTVIYAQEYWEIVQLLIPYAIKWKENKFLPQTGWEFQFGLDEALRFAAKCGNMQAMLSLIKAGVSLDIGIFNNQKSVLDYAAKYNHLPLGALSLYLKPGLEQRNRITHKFEWQNPAIINNELVESSKLYTINIRIFLERCILLLRAFSSTGSIFSHCPKDLHPMFFVKLVLAMSEDLYLNIENTVYKDRINLHLTEQQIVNVLSNINWTHKILAVIEGYVKQFIYLGVYSTAPEALDVFINEVHVLHDAKKIQHCVHKAITSPKDAEKRSIIKNFLFEYNVLTKEQANETVYQQPKR